MEDKKDKDEPKTEESKTDGNKDDNAKLIEEALKSFCCYLYVGKGHRYYKAEPWNDDDSYSISERLQPLEVLASNKETELVPIDKIKLAMDSKLSRRPETLMFALAMCARQKKSEKLRAGAYYFLAEHCKEWKYFILFIKYASILCKMEDSADKDKTSKRIGWGHGWKNAVNKWYLTKDPMELASLVAKRKGGCGWKHKDILKLSHPDSTNLEVEKRAILCYVMRGIDEAEKQYLSDPEARRVLNYIRLIELFKKSLKLTELVDSMLINGTCTIDDIHPKVLKTKKIWTPLLARMDIRTVLKYLPKMNELELLTKQSPITTLVVDTLTNENNLHWNKLLPGDILRVLDRYEEAPNPSMTYRLCFYKVEESSEPPEITRNTKKKRVQTIRRPKCLHGLASDKKRTNTQKIKKSKSPKQKIKCPPTPKLFPMPDMRILDALRAALRVTQQVDITDSSERTYLVSIRLPARKYRNACTEAGVAIALPLFHRLEMPESAVTVIGYEPKLSMGSLPTITADMDLDEALRELIKVNRYNDHENLVDMEYGPVGWAMQHEKKYDVFINVTTEPPHRTFFQILKYYKKCEPNARLVNVIMSRAPFKLTADGCEDTLTIYGFDPHVPWIIEAYARGLF